MRLFHAGTGTRMSVPDHMAARYLGKGWVQAGGITAAFNPPAPAGESTPGGRALTTPDEAPSGVVTLNRGLVPDGSAKDVIDWVGEDRDRARAALDAEQARGDDARTTLVAKLAKLAGR